MGARVDTSTMLGFSVCIGMATAVAAVTKVVPKSSTSVSISSSSPSKKSNIHPLISQSHTSLLPYTHTAQQKVKQKVRQTYLSSETENGGCRRSSKRESLRIWHKLRYIVLGHGFGTDQSLWKHLVPHLVDEFRVVLYDNMGAGTTNPDYFDFERYSTLEGYAYDLLAILEELHIDSCIFVGHSVSAMIGAIASISRPDLFSKLIMISGSPR